jgi:hypothetical protein
MTNAPSDPASVHRVFVHDPNGDHHALTFLRREDATRFAVEARRRTGWSILEHSSQALMTLDGAMRMLTDGSK